MILGQKQLNICRTGERAATVERMVLTRSSRKRQQSLQNSFWRKLVLFSQGTITDGSLPGNAFLPWLQSTNNSGACTPPTSQWRAIGCFISLFAADNTEIGKAPQMLNSHNWHAQCSIQWSCVQLKQHRQWPENDGTWKLPPTPRADYQMRIKTRSDTETFLVCPVEMRSQLGVLLEIPSIPWSESNQKYTQKTVQNLELAQNTMKVLQLPKKCSKQCEMGIKLDTS